MKILIKITFLAILSMGFINTADAFCAKCAAIEKARAEENAKKGPQPVKYYEDEHKDKIISTENNEPQKIENTVAPTKNNPVK